MTSDAELTDSERSILRAAIREALWGRKAVDTAAFEELFGITRANAEELLGALKAQETADAAFDDLTLLSFLDEMLEGATSISSTEFHPIVGVEKDQAEALSDKLRKQIPPPRTNRD